MSSDASVQVCNVDTWHAKEATWHRQLGCLRKVGKHGTGRCGYAPLEAALWLWSLPKGMMSHYGLLFADTGHSWSRSWGEGCLLL